MIFHLYFLAMDFWALQSRQTAVDGSSWWTQARVGGGGVWVCPALRDLALLYSQVIIMAED
jgi:hypothetical protein